MLSCGLEKHVTYNVNELLTGFVQWSLSMTYNELCTDCMVKTDDMCFLIIMPITRNSSMSLHPDIYVSHLVGMALFTVAS